ncbi:hypothetical protein AB833_16165 [Chromatiales bacterium (ex Bugula neritina AB1)]|nr:hypothetical protein AB833_16165 [Chromatiales bacterium (ex Bugula neritina AB1)]
MASEFEPRAFASARKVSVAPDEKQRWPWSAGVTAGLAFVWITAIALVSISWGYRHFEQRLATRTQAALMANDIDASGLQFEWDYRDLTVTGTLPDDVSVSRLTELLRAVDKGGIRELEISARESPATDINYRATGVVDVSAKLHEGVLYLNGTVLSQAQRSQLKDAASRAVGNNVVDQLRVSGLKESIPGSDQRVESLANSIAGLHHALDADAELSATDFRFSATVSDENDVDDLLRRRGVAGNLGLVISGDIIAKKSSPGGGILEVNSIYDSGRISLSGVVVSEQQKQLLLDTAFGIAGSEGVSDDLIVASAVEDSGTSDARVRLIASAMTTFSAVIEASVRLRNTDFVVNALFEFEEDSNELLNIRSRAVQLGLNVEGEIQSKRISLSREVALLQQEIDDLADEIRENVIFESADAELDFVAKQTLDKIVDAMNRHQRPVVEITGHTDNTGTDEENRELSLQRAASVSEYLRFSGISETRLISLGLGESLHIANNQTEFGKKQNRRVEFRVRARLTGKP